MWVTGNKERKIQGISRGNWYSGRRISSSQIPRLSLSFMDVSPKHLMLAEWKGTLKIRSCLWPMPGIPQPTVKPQEAYDDPAEVPESCTLRSEELVLGN